MLKRNHRLYTLAASAVLAVAVSAPLRAQTLYGSMVGNVTDPSGASVPGATVTATNTGTKFIREAMTDERGSYLFSDLQPGPYDVTISAASFAAFTRTGVHISTNAVTRMDAQLQLATTVETISVAASAVTLQTDRAEVRSEVDRRQVTDLPVPGVRNFTSLLRLVPGVSPPRPAHTLAANPQESQVVNVGGQDDERNDTRIDGAGNTFIWLPRLIAYSPPLETIEAVNIVTNSMDAEQGVAAGAAVNVVTKSGTNELHGTLFEFHTNSSLKARNVFFAQARQPKYIQNQWGGTLGGPIVRTSCSFSAAMSAPTGEATCLDSSRFRPPSSAGGSSAGSASRSTIR
jgi:hypothetical protein